MQPQLFYRISRGALSARYYHLLLECFGGRSRRNEIKQLSGAIEFIKVSASTIPHHDRRFRPRGKSRDEGPRLRREMRARRAPMKL
jgi:hypothetical protein